MKKRACIALAVPFLFTLSALADSHINWSYSGDSAPEKWGQLSQEFTLCEKGSNQSPVDIRHAIKGVLPPLTLTFNAAKKNIVKNTHTVQINIHNGDDMTLDGELFTLEQFHFHAPSENRIDGKIFPLEAHFVHSNKNNEIAVVSVMFTEGKENPVIAEILQNIPAKINEAQPLNKPLALSHLMPGDKAYYRFSGSLTTPPCTEGVRWLVMKNPVSLSAKQITAFQTALGQENNRPVQQLHGRVIVN